MNRNIAIQIIVLILFLFPLSLPDLDDRTYQVVCDSIQGSPAYALDPDPGKIVFGDGQSGRRLPSEKSKHEEAGGHIVFVDDEHGVLNSLCSVELRIN